MKGNLKNKNDVKAVDDASKGSSGKYIKIDKGKNFIRFLSTEFTMEFVHTLQNQNDIKQIVCLGGEKRGGYAPDICPICEQAKKHWDKIKKIKLEGNFGKSQKLQFEAEFEKKKGMELRAQRKVVMVAMKGSLDEDNSKKVNFDGEPRLLNITPAQWEKITKTIFEEYSFMKSSEDLTNRNMCFLKEDKTGKKSGKYTEVKIIPSKNVSPKPKIKGEIPNLDTDVFVYKKYDEVKNQLNEFLELTEDDVNDDSSIETKETEDDDFEKEFSEEESEFDVKKNKKVKSKSKNDSDEDF